MQQLIGEENKKGPTKHPREGKREKLILKNNRGILNVSYDTKDKRNKDLQTYEHEDYIYLQLPTHMIRNIAQLRLAQQFNFYYFAKMSSDYCNVNKCNGK